MRNPRITLMLVVALVTGCASRTEPARVLARETLTEVVAYDQNVRSFHESLAKAYADHLSETAKTIAVAEQATTDAARHALAVEAVDQILAGGFKEQNIRKFVTASAIAGAQTIARLETALDNVRAKEIASVAFVAEAEEKVKTVRRNLEGMQQRPKAKEQLSIYAGLLSAGRDALKEKKP